ncbi:MAG: hypothetical protein J3Q66DRAFT_322358 [Benniella sp.]|nr:MAG: hypothetical protein J3Q66DRAFT_322358 [Benniella sp.]
MRGSLRFILCAHILPARANSVPHSANQSAGQVLPDMRYHTVGIAAAVALVARFSTAADLAPVVLFAIEDV